VGISVARECAWTAASQAAWIQISSATTGQGDGSVSFRVAANADPVERRGALGVADQIASVTQQAAPCKFDVQASAQEIASTGGQTPVVVQTQDACTWNASSNTTWVSLTPVSGHGTASITATALPNNGAERTAMVTVGQGQLLLRQASAAASPIPPPVPPPTPGPTPAPNPAPPSPTPPPTPGPGPSPKPPPEDNEVKGKLDHLVGVCPDVWFTVGDRLVHATVLTDYKKNQSCRDLQAGKGVSVNGIPQVLLDPHFLLATSIEIKK